MKIIAFIGFWWFTCLYANLLYAQGRLDKDTLQMKTIELFGTRTVQNSLMKSVQTDSATLQNHQNETLAGLLSQSSVYVKDYGPSMVATPSFRGTAEDHTKTYWNGVPLNSSMYGIQDLNLVPVFLLDGVDIHYGGASLASGSGGFGGSLDLKSDPRNEPSQLRLFSTIGSFGEQKNALAYNYGNSHIWGSTKLYEGTAQNNFPYTNTFQWGNPRQTEQDASMYQYGILQTIGWQPTDKDMVKADAWYQNSYRNLPQTMISGTNHEDQKDESLRTIVNYNHYEQGYTWGVDGSFVREYLFYHNTLSDINSPSDNERYEIQGHFSPDFDIPLHLTAGLGDVEESANILEYYGLKKRNRASLWANADYVISKYFVVGLIGRTESINLGTPAWAGTASFAYKPLKNNKLVAHINGGHNYNYPNLNDLYWYPGGNPSLQPEHTWFGEAGLRSELMLKHDNELHADATVFSNLIDNYIQWTPQGGSYWQAQNLKTVWARGIEASAGFSHRWHQSALYLNAAWQYTPSTDQSQISAYDQTVGKQLIYVPLYTSQASARWALRQYAFTAEYTYSGARNTTDIQLPPYSLVNLFAGRNFVWGKLHFNLTAKCYNVFNTTYQVIVWRPMPGRWYELSLTANI